MSSIAARRRHPAALLVVLLLGLVMVGGLYAVFAPKSADVLTIRLAVHLHGQDSVSGLVDTLTEALTSSIIASLISRENLKVSTPWEAVEQDEQGEGPLTQEVLTMSTSHGVPSGYEEHLNICEALCDIIVHPWVVDGWVLPT